MSSFVIEAQCDFCIDCNGTSYNIRSDKIRCFAAGNTKLVKRIGPFSCCQPQRICYPVGYPITVTYEILLDEILPLELFSEFILQDPLFSKKKTQDAYLGNIEVWLNGRQSDAFYLCEGQLILPIYQLVSYLQGKRKIIIRTTVTFCKTHNHAKVLGRPECCLLLSAYKQPDLVIPDEHLGEGKIIKGDLRFIKLKESEYSSSPCEIKSIYHITLENMSHEHSVYLKKYTEIDGVTRKEKITMLYGYEGLVVIKDQYVVCEEKIKIKPREKICIFYETIKYFNKI